MCATPAITASQRFTTGGAFSWGLRLGGHGDGQFTLPVDVALDSFGNAYVADLFGDRIQKFSATGTFLSVFAGAGPGRRAGGTHVRQLRKPGRHRVGNARVQVFSPDGVPLRTFGSQGTGPGQFDSPNKLQVDAQGLIYVADTGNDRVEVFRGDGTLVATWGTQGSLPGQFFRPLDVAVDDLGRVYVLDKDNHRIQKFDVGATPARAVSWGRVRADYR
jgi:DNA-binding beta-propeller fold protein YncE